MVLSSSRLRNWDSALAAAAAAAAAELTGGNEDDKDEARSAWLVVTAELGGVEEVEAVEV